MHLDPQLLARLCVARERLTDPDAFGRSVDEIAAEVRLSRGRFIRLFALVFGETPHQFRTQARLARARHLLATRRLSVTDVCFELGFSSLGSFSTLFTRHTGETPSAYARRVRPLIQVPPHSAASLVPGCLTLMLALPPGTLRTFREASPAARDAHSRASNGGTTACESN